MKKTLIIIGCVVLTLGVIGAYVTYRLHEKIHAAPEIEELALTDTVLVDGVRSNQVVCLLSLKGEQAGLVGCRLEGYKYISGAMLYRAEWKVGLLNEDTLFGDTMVFYYEQRDPIVCADKAPEVHVELIPYEDKPSEGKIMVYCYTEEYLHDLFAQPITEIGFYTSRGIVKLPVCPETSEKLAQRYALILEHFAQH